ncbi:MAG: DUF2085 domain-containing protein [Candidatus Bathyarchaeota archaeon]|nr:MAG: DUF2085 domain-containing protein [Candidatus Bathyarchaeota archaeon]
MSYIEDTLVHIFNNIGNLICHQIPERTLWIGGSYLPVCARDTGAYLGFYLGYLLLSMRKKEACGPPNLWVTFFMITPMIVDAGTQFIGLRTSTNELRLITGLLFGAALAPFLVYSLAQIPTSRKLPILRNFLPKNVNLDDKNSWLNHQALGFGLLIAVALFFLINSITGSTNNLFYWLLSPLIIISVVLHIFLLPIFLAISFLAYLKNRHNP